MSINIGFGELLIVVIIFIIITDPKDIKFIITEIKTIKKKIQNYINLLKHNINNILK